MSFLCAAVNEIHCFSGGLVHAPAALCITESCLIKSDRSEKEKKRIDEVKEPLFLTVRLLGRGR